MSRVEVLSDSDDESAPQKPKSSSQSQSDSSRAPGSLVGPPRPPEGVVLKRAGKKKTGAPKVDRDQKSDQKHVIAKQETRDKVDDDDDSDDVPPPLEPLPFVAQKLAAGQKLKEEPKTATKAKDVEQTKLPPKDKEEAAAATVKEETPKKPLIGPPKPTASTTLTADAKKKDSEHSSSSSSTSSSSSSRPSYLERDLLEHPLFLNDLPKEPSSNPDVAALQAMVAEETPEERAENFKNSGNECLQNGGARWWDDAIEYYTRAIQCGSRDLLKVSIYFSNRAAVQMLKKNWGHASRDCLEALELDPNNAKAMYRAGKSFYEVRKLPEALKYLRMAMAKAKNQQLLDLERDIGRAMRKEALKDEKRKKEADVALEAESEVASLIRERGYKFSYDDIYSAKERMSQFGSKVKIETSEVPARRGGGGGGMITELCTPVVVVYPQSHQSDFVQSWGENLFIRDLLETLLKEHESSSQSSDSWDRWGLYNTKEIGNMCVYIKTNDVFDTFEKQEWIQVKLSSTLGEAMKVHPHYIIPVVPVFFVFHNSFKKDFFSPEAQSMWGTPAKRVEED